MAAFDRTRTTWTYTTDNGDTFSFNALTGYTAQASVLGGDAWESGHLKPAPKGFRPRKALLWLGSDHTKRRRVVCFEPDATAYTTLTTAVSVDVGGTATAYAVYQSEGERHKFEGGQAPTPA